MVGDAPGQIRNGLNRARGNPIGIATSVARPAFNIVRIDGHGRDVASAESGFRPTQKIRWQDGVGP
jgi:hypothetical protein